MAGFGHIGPLSVAALPMTFSKSFGLSELALELVSIQRHHRLSLASLRAQPCEYWLSSGF